MSFGDLIDAADEMILETLGDGTAAHLSQAGSVLVEGVPIELNRNVEAPDFSQGVVDRVTTIAFRKARVLPFDRRGAFRLEAGEVLHIDRIISDDGHLITLSVKP